MKKGFTLIELLVVITLIGILAVAVLSAINPIEQINKARDASKRADASQLISALDRYFASNLKFPWNNYADYAESTDAAFYGNARMVGVGVCTAVGGDVTTGIAENSDASGCLAEVDAGGVNHYGYLIETQELKSQFAKRNYFKVFPTLPTADKLFVVKLEGDPSVSICFMPQSKATRDTFDDTDPTSGADTTKLKQLTWVGTGEDAIPSAIAPWPSTETPDWTDVTLAAFVCIPEE
ncbi:MAG: type II secretion system protein [Candidatus Beckwithbacteria bacterium]